MAKNDWHPSSITTSANTLEDNIISSKLKLVLNLFVKVEFF